LHKKAQDWGGRTPKKKTIDEKGGNKIEKKKRKNASTAAVEKNPKPTRKPDRKKLLQLSQRALHHFPKKSQDVGE